MYRYKKGQAAMEFLMTYGWAILAAIVVIGALGVYFYFNSSTQNLAVVNAPFYAEASSIGTTQVQLGLKNNGGQDVTVTGITVTATDGSLNYTTGDISTTISSGSTVDFNLGTVQGTATSGNSYKADVVIKYTKGDSSINQTSTGTLTGTIV